MTMRETGPSGFKTKFIRNLKVRFPNCVVLLTDPQYLQGVPDILMLLEDTWFAFEVKATKTSSRRPNQEWWIDILNRQSYASFVYPENEEEVIREVQQSLEARRRARLS